MMIPKPRVPNRMMQGLQGKGGDPSVSGVASGSSGRGLLSSPPPKGGRGGVYGPMKMPKQAMPNESYVPVNANGFQEPMSNMIDRTGGGFAAGAGMKQGPDIAGNMNQAMPSPEQVNQWGALPQSEKDKYFQQGGAPDFALPQMTDRQMTRQKFLMNQGRTVEAQQVGMRPPQTGGPSIGANVQPMGGFMRGNANAQMYNRPQAAPLAPSAMRRRG